jgi:hypothetical protein
MGTPPFVAPPSRYAISSGAPPRGEKYDKAYAVIKNEGRPRLGHADQSSLLRGGRSSRKMALPGRLAHGGAVVSG